MEVVFGVVVSTGVAYLIKKLEEIEQKVNSLIVSVAILEDDKIDERNKKG